MSKESETQEHRSDQTMLSLALVMGAGVLGILIYASQFGSFQQFASIAGVGVVMAGASAAGGGLLGFLFGIPRTSRQKRAAEDAGTDGPDHTRYGPNTNLEEISDWLTKILVGVGLTQLREISSGMENLAAKLGPVLGNSASSGAFAVTVLLFFVICGFLEAYLWTRLFLAGEFRLADLTALGQQVEQVRTEAKEAVRKIEEQIDKDAHALALALSQLNPAAGAPPIAQSDLEDAVRAASPHMRAQVFYQAQALRTAEWNRDKARMELTIPVFRALVACDPEGRYHRNHAQLGYALKDQRKPNWAEALAQLNAAIEIRGPWEERGWVWYEFNRGVCWIAQDEAYRQGQPSTGPARERIIADLQVAATELALVFDRDERIKSWLALNSVQPEDLAGKARAERTAGRRVRQKQAGV